MRKQPRSVHADTFHFTDRGEHWAWSAEVTWRHQLRGVVGRHKRLVSGWVAKSLCPQILTLDAVLEMLNNEGQYRWAAASTEADKGVSA